MKLILTFSLVLAIGALAMTPEQEAKMEKVSKPCREETGVNLEEVRQVRSGQVTDDAKIKKYVLCVGKKLGLIDESGANVGDTLRSRIRSAVASDEEADKILKQCTEGVEDTVVGTVKCVYANVPNFSPVE